MPVVELTSLEIEGKTVSRLQNDHVRLSVIDETGHVVSFYSRRTGHENLWISGDGIRRDRGAWGIEIPYVGPLTARPDFERTEAETALSFHAENDALEQTVTYRLRGDTTRVRVQVRLSNKSAHPVRSDLRFMYHINVASDAEVSGILSHGPRFNSMTVAHGKHHFFVGRETEWPGEGHWENHEVGEDVYEPFAVRQSIWLRPRWFAFVDQSEEEGFAVRFLRPPGFARAWMEGYPFSNASNVQHDIDAGHLEPGQSKVFEMEWLLFEALQRVDHVGPATVLGIDLCRSLLLDERQTITVRAVSTEAKARLSGRLSVKSNVVELEEVIGWTFDGIMAQNSAQFHVGPYNDREKLHAIWYYISKKPGDCGRPTPHVDLYLDDTRVQRKYAPSPETQEIVERIQSFVEEVRAAFDRGEGCQEDLAALLAVQREADACRREVINPDRLYDLCDRAKSFHRAWQEGQQRTLFGKEMARQAAQAEPVQAWLAESRKVVLTMTPEDLTLPKPGRQGFIKSIELSISAARAAMVYASSNDNACGRVAVRALTAFAADHRRYVTTGAGNILHMSLSLPPLIIAYDLARDLMTLEEERDLLAYFFWLGTFMEQYVNAKGDNDEIHESGCIAWVNGRFPCLPGAQRRIMRAHAVLTRQMRVIDQDGGWPESPNYNTQVMSAYLSHAVLFERIGMSITGKFGGVSINMMVDWLIRVLTPSYRIPQLGDGVNRGPSPDMFLLAAYLYKDGRYLHTALNMPDTATLIRWIPAAWLCYPVQVTPQPAQKSASEVLPHTGYLILRSGLDQDAHFFISDFGPHKPGHGHMDKLSFELYAFGENLVRDTGYGFGQSKDHNLILVDGKSQPRLCGRLNRFESRTDEDEAVMEAEVEPGVLHRRFVYYRRGRFFIIHDSIASEKARDYSWRLHFDGIAIQADGGVTYRAPGGAGLVVVPEGPAPVTVEEAETVVYSDEKGLSSRPISRIRMDMHADRALFTTLLVPFRDQAPEVDVSTEREGDRLVLHIHLDGVAHTLRMEGDTWEIK